MTFLILLALFTWLLLAAVISTVFPEREKLSFVVAIILSLMVVATVSYAVAMAVIHSRPSRASLPVDASGPVITGVSFLFSAALTAMWGIAWRLVETKQNGAPGFSEMRRNAMVFFAGSAVLTACFLSWFVVALLELTVDYYKYRDVSLGLGVTSLMLTVLAVLAYSGKAVIAAGRGQGKSSGKSAGYVPLDDSTAPARYADY